MERDGGAAARRRRTASSRRPHSQPDKLLSCMNSPTNNGESSDKQNLEEDRNAPVAKKQSDVRTFKRRETNTNTVIKQAEPEPKRRRPRVVIEASDEESSEEEHFVEKKAPSSSKTRTRQQDSPKPPANEGLALRKSSRVVKRKAFDDDELEEVKRRSRLMHEMEMAQMKLEAENNSDSAEDERPRKRSRRGSMQDIQASSPVFREKPLTARQRQSQEKTRNTRQKSTAAVKDVVTQETTSSSGKEEQQKADSPGSSAHDSETRDRTIPLTARQRSLQACKDGEANPNLIEFPEGLNCLDRRRKAKLSEEEKLAKKAEAATKRKQQVEKAAKEIQESAIQKILNQDSNRKKREEKIQKQKQEIAEGKKAAEQEVATNSIRWVMGPSGTTVSFAQDVEIPLLFSTAPVCYPPPREKCAGCNNPYKYRDSKSRLPLCSLQCYKTIRQNNNSLEAH